MKAIEVIEQLILEKNIELEEHRKSMDKSYNHWSTHHTRMISMLTEQIYTLENLKTELIEQTNKRRKNVHQNLHRD